MVKNKNGGTKKEVKKVSEKVNKHAVDYLNNVIGSGDGRLKGFMVAKELPEVRPAITLDNFNRIYFNADARDSLNLYPQIKLVIAYNPESKMFAVIKAKDSDLYGEYVSVVDKRYYANIKYLVEHFRIKSKHSDTAYYDYVGKDSAGKAYLFKLRG